MPGALTPNDRLPERSAPIAVPEADKPGVFESIGLATATSIDLWTDAQRGRRAIEHKRLAALLEQRGYARDAMRIGVERGSVLGIPLAVESDDLDGRKIWAAIEAERQADPEAFADIPANSYAEFDRWIIGRKGQRAADQRRLAEGSVVGRFVGDAAADMADSEFGPLQFLIGGGGKTVLQTALREGVVAVTEEALKQPERIRNRAALGEATTTADIALDIGSTFVFAGALGGAGHYLGDNWDAIKAAPQAVQERAWAAILEKTPGLRAKVGSEIDWDRLDPHLPDIAEATIGRDKMDPGQLAAVDTLRREGHFAQASPYADDAAGRTAHLDGMKLAMKRIMEGAPALPVPLAPRPVRAQLGDSTAVASRTVADDPFSTLKRRIGVIESNNSDTAKNPRSSATGRYQFIGSTWLRLYRNRYGQNGLSDTAILAKRTDGRLQEVLMDDLLQHNADALEAAGIPVDAGNLYLAHFAGSGGARALHRASPNTSARSVLGDAVVDANPFLARMNAREVIAWAARKMGGGGEAAPVTMRGAENSASDAIEAELASLRSEREALLQDAGAARVDGGTEDSPFLVDDIAEDIPTLRADLVPASDLDEGVRDAIPALREVIADRSRSINAIDDIAEELGLRSEQVRRGLTELAQRGEIVMNVPRGTRQRLRSRNGRFRDESDAELLAARGGVWDGKFMRRPPAPVRPVNTLGEWISERGGLKDEGGDLRAMGGAEWHRAKPFRQSLIASEGEGIAPDDALTQAIEAGFFPELAGRPQDTYADLPDVQLLFDALGEELAGRPRTRADLLEGEAAGDRFDSDHPDYAPILSFVTDELETLGFDRATIPAEWIDELAAEVFNRPGGMSDEDAVFYGLHAMDERLAGEAFAETGELAYEPVGYDEFARQFDDESYRAAADDSWRRAADAEPAGEGGLPGGGAGEGAGAPQALERGPLDTTRYQDYDDPQGDAARGQRDSMAHDLRQMEGQEDDSIGPFGPVFEDVDPSDWQAVVARLTDAQTGEVRGVLQHPATGLIDVVWGKEGTGASDGYGLAKIVRFHAEVVDDLPAIIRNMTVAESTGNRIRLESPDHSAAISLDWHGDEKVWLLTAYARKGKSPSATDDGRAAESDSAARAGNFPALGDDADIVDRARADKLGQQARLRAAAPMRGENVTGEAQDGVHSFDPANPNLFDATDQHGFRFDTEGEAQSLPDLIADLDADEAELKAIKDCLL